MKPFEYIYDMKMTDDGDLQVSDGDITLTNGVEWFIQEVHKILMTTNPEWWLHPNVGASLEDFAGLPNTREVGKAMEKRVHDRITVDNIEYPGNVVVKVVPISKDAVTMKVILEIGDLTEDISKISFDYNDGIISFPDIDAEEVKTVTRTTGQATVEATNKYMGRRSQI